MTDSEERASEDALGSTGGSGGPVARVDHPRAVRRAKADPVLTGQVPVTSRVLGINSADSDDTGPDETGPDEDEEVPEAEEPVKFPWEDPLAGGQG